MLAVYGIDVLDPRVTPRRILSLARRLPAGAWPDRASAASWSTEAYLLAAVFDLLGNLTYITARAYGAKSARRPEPLDRPGAGNPRESAAKPRVRWGDVARDLVGQPGVTVTNHG